jgi:hypothetical protein
MSTMASIMIILGGHYKSNIMYNPQYSFMVYLFRVRGDQRDIKEEF